METKLKTSHYLMIISIIAVIYTIFSLFGYYYDRPQNSGIWRDECLLSSAVAISCLMIRCCLNTANGNNSYYKLATNVPV